MAYAEAWRGEGRGGGSPKLVVWAADFHPRGFIIRANGWLRYRIVFHVSVFGGVTYLPLSEHNLPKHQTRTVDPEAPHPPLKY